VLLAPLLVVLAAVQLALPSRVELPPVAGIARVTGGAMPPDPPPVLPSGALATQSLFAPTGAATGAATAPPDPLNGAVIAGVVQRGSQRLALVQGPGAALHYVAPGGTVAGWRLIALGPASALLRRGHDHLDLAYGAHPVSPASTPSADKTP
jgi:hypothetical protein